MDPRCNPNEFWKFSEEGPAVIRNAGGRVTEDTLRSIRVLSGIMSNGRNTVGAVAVVHHRDCGLLNFSNEKVKEQLKIKAELNEQRAKEVDRMEFGSFSEYVELTPVLVNAR
jgi:carbonic anhydrase